jgi:hypothetical protein
MIEVLSVFEEATLQFCEENSTCSMILPTLIFLRKFLDRKTVESQAAKELDFLNSIFIKSRGIPKISEIPIPIPKVIIPSNPDPEQSLKSRSRA